MSQRCGDFAARMSTYEGLGLGAGELAAVASAAIEGVWFPREFAARLPLLGHALGEPPEPSDERFADEGDYHLWVDGEPVVMANRLGITDPAQLSLHEAGLAAARHVQLLESPNRVQDGRLRAGHLGALHAHLFGDSYDWAGRWRVSDLVKPRDGGGVSEFIPASGIPAALDLVFSQAPGGRLFDGPGLDRRAADLYAALNVVHPFRDGNGRVTRLLMDRAVAVLGWRIDWAGIGGVHHEAVIAAFEGEPSRLREAFSDALVRLEPSG